MDVKPVSGLNRRKGVRRDEDIWRVRHIDALENVLSDLAYEVRNISVIVPTINEELRQEIGKIVEAPIQERQEFKERWMDALKYMSDKAQQLIDRTRQVPHQVKISQCSLRTLVEGVLKSWASIAEKNGVLVECQGIESLPTVSAYEWRLEALFSPPITRAIQVTPSGGSVKVSGRVDQVKNLAIIEVKDIGANVPINVCDAFNRGDDLDLSDSASLKTWVMLDMQGVRKLAQIHGCQIAIESREGDGTTCSIHVPLDNVIQS
jgi:signal transduction histidine kinase